MATRITTIHPASEQERAPHSALRRLVACHPVAAYLLMAFTISWAILLPVVLSKQGFGVLPIELPVSVFLPLASYLGLALPAFLVAAATGGKAGVRDLLHRSLRWRVGIRWYLIALLGTFVVVLLGAIPFLGLIPLDALATKWDLLFTVFLPGVLGPFLTINLPEEIGWTSLQARLQDRHGPIRASVMVAPAFAAMHLPAFFVTGWLGEGSTSLAQVPSALLSVGIISVFGVFFRLLIMWLYNGAGRSLLIAALFHSAFNMSSGQKITPEFVPDPALSWLPSVAVLVVALLVVAFTKGRLAYKAELASEK